MASIFIKESIYTPPPDMLQLIDLLPPPVNVQQFAARFEVCWIWAKNYLSIHFLNTNLTDTTLHIIESALAPTIRHGVIFKASRDKYDPSKVTLDWDASLSNKGLEEYINSAKGRDEVSQYFMLDFHPVPSFKYKEGDRLYRNKDGKLEVIIIKKAYRDKSRSMYSVSDGDYLLTKEEWAIDSYTKDKDKVVAEIEERLKEEEYWLKERRKILDTEKKVK